MTETPRIRRGRGALRKLVRLAGRHARPRWRLGLAVVVGAVIGCSPLFGLHLLLCILAAKLLRLNLVAMYAAANISIPPLAPFLGFASVQLGERMRHGAFLPVDEIPWRSASPMAVAGEFMLDWLAGGLVVGLVVGCLLAAVVTGLAALRDRRQPVAPRRLPSLRDARERYLGDAPRVRWYAAGKYLLDPVYRVTARLLRPASVLDLGAGVGLMATLLAGRGSTVVAVEHDPAKVDSMRRAAAGLPVTVIEGDLRTCELPACDAALLVDVLHYQDATEIQPLLRRVVTALRPGGLLLVRDHDGSRRGRAAGTRLIERLSVRWGCNRASRVRFLRASEMSASVAALGLRPRLLDVSSCLFPGNVLLIARKPSASVP